MANPDIQIGARNLGVNKELNLPTMQTPENLPQRITRGAIEFAKQTLATSVREITLQGTVLTTATLVGIITAAGLKISGQSFDTSIVAGAVVTLGVGITTDRFLRRHFTNP